MHKIRAGVITHTAKFETKGGIAKHLEIQPPEPDIDGLAYKVLTFLRNTRTTAAQQFIGLRLTVGCNHIPCI